MKLRYKLFVLLTCLLLLFSFFDILTYFGLPNQFQIIEGRKHYLEPNLLFWAQVSSKQEDDLKINGEELNDRGFKVNLADSFSLKSAMTGSYKINFKLFGLIPLRQMSVDVLPQAKVIPGGHSIGVAVKSDGIMVVGSSYVKDDKDNKFYPASDAGIKPGDLILSVNGTKIKDKHQLAKLIDYYGQQEEQIVLGVKKQSEQIVEKEVAPIENKQGYNMIGLYVDDSATGVGTISFYDEKTGYYGALGHMITEKNTQLGINIGQGDIYQANISGIRRSEKGMPGEKLGSFFRNHNFLGDITKNNEFGIFGELSTKPGHPYFKEAIPVASPLEVKEGKAKAYTVINGQKIKEFDVEIKNVKKQYRPDKKGLIIRIKDPEVLRKTGGIVQGMSGSPIVQENKLVGAITHVFVNDSTLGYATFAQWMLLQTEILANKKEKEQIKKEAREFSLNFSGIFFIIRKDFRSWY